MARHKDKGTLWNLGVSEGVSGWWPLTQHALSQSCSNAGFLCIMLCLTIQKTRQRWIIWEGQVSTLCPSFLGSYSHKLTALVTPWSMCYTAEKPISHLVSVSPPHILVSLRPLILVSREKVFQAEVWFWALINSVANTGFLCRASCRWKHFSFLIYTSDIPHPIKVPTRVTKYSSTNFSC